MKEGLFFFSLWICKEEKQAGKIQGEKQILETQTILEIIMSIMEMGWHRITGFEGKII